MERCYDPGFTIPAGSYNFNNFLLAKFRHPSIDTVLGDDPGKCRDNADDGGIKNIIC